MKVMVWYFWSDMDKVMTTLILVVFIWFCWNWNYRYLQVLLWRFLYNLVDTFLMIVLAMEFFQENVLAESRMMIPDCRKRLEGAFTTLQAAVVKLFTLMC